MTANHPNEKAADVLAHVNGEASTYPEEAMNQHTEPQTYEIRLEDRGQSTGIAYATYAGEKLPMSDHRRAIIPWELILAAHHHGSVTVTISADDIAEYDRRIFAERARREERERDAVLLAEAKARALAEAQELLDQLDTDSLTREGANK